MIDSYGDGWNGGSVDVSVNGGCLAGPACTGSFDAVPFDAATGDIISTSNWNPGSWPGEINFLEILDGGGAIIMAGVVNVDTSVAGNCPACLPPTALTASNATTNSADLA